MEDLRNKKILILGLSKSGISAAKYLSKKGAVCYITESNKNKLDDFDNKLEIIEDIKKYNRHYPFIEIIEKAKWWSDYYWGAIKRRIIPNG